MELTTILENLELLYKRNTHIQKIIDDLNKNQGKTIILNNYQFTSINKGVANKREHVLIESKNVSTNDTLQFAYYRSNSEGGYWRACVYSGLPWAGIPYKYEKGSDYVTSSFVDLYLQNFINKNYDQLPNLDNILDECKFNFKNENASLNQISKIIVDNERIISDPILYALSKCKSGKCFRNKFDINEYIDSLNSNKKYEQELKKKFEAIQKENLTLNQSIIKIYEGISEYIKEYFTCDLSTISEIGEYTFKYSDNIRISHNFYKIIIQNKVNNQKYRLFYSRYQYINENKTDFNGTYYSIVNIVPLDAKTNQFGLYDKIMSVGIYIYKIIEYKDQCNIDDKNREIDITGSSTCYTFIGDFMSNVWPLNIIQQNI